MKRCNREYELTSFEAVSFNFFVNLVIVLQFDIKVIQLLVSLFFAYK